MIVESRLACSARSSRSWARCSGVEHVEALLQRDRGAVHRGERRPQLVRDRGDEVRLRLVEALVLGDVAERVDDSVREADAGRVDPELLRPDVERHRGGLHAAVAARARRRRGSAAPPPASRGWRSPRACRSTFLAGIPVISSAAWFQKRTMPCGSSRSTPSATCSSTRSAIARCCCATRVRASSGARAYAMSITAASTSSPISDDPAADRRGGVLDGVVRREDGEPRRLRAAAARCARYSLAADHDRSRVERPIAASDGRDRDRRRDDAAAAHGAGDLVLTREPGVRRRSSRASARSSVTSATMLPTTRLPETTSTER